MTNENFRRELGQVFDDMAGSPSAALPDRVRSSLADAPDHRGPFWIAGLAAALIAVVVIGVLVVANPLNRLHSNAVPGAGSTPTPSAASSPSPSPNSTPASVLPRFGCTSSAPISSTQAPAVAFIDAVATGTYAGYDRITIGFQNGVPGKVDVAVQNNATFVQGASGQSVTLVGSTGLLITIQGADEHTAYGGPIDFKTGYPALVEARQMQDFEGTVQWGLGLSKSACYRAFIILNPIRLVIDVEAS
jgi:hypothetical protein